MGNENPYDAPALPSMKSGPAADEHTEVALQQKRANGVLPVDDETNFGDLENAIGRSSAGLDESLLSVDPRALAARLASASDDVGDPQPLPRKGGLSPEKRRELSEDEPTLLGGPAGRLDPKELARQLAEQAKARLAAQKAPEPEKPVVKEDPVALAKRLAEEAKARIAAEAEKKRAAETIPEPEPPKPSIIQKNPAAKTDQPKEDPVALARRLAAEAKARMTPQPAQPREPVAVPPEPKKKAKATPPPPPPRAPELDPASLSSTDVDAASEAREPTGKGSKRRSKSLLERAPRAKSGRSAVEAIKVYTTEPSPERVSAPPRKATPEPAAPRAEEPQGRRIETPTPPPMRATEILAEVAKSSGLTTSPPAPPPLPPEPEADETAPSAPAPQVDATETVELHEHLDVLRDLLPDAVIESERPVRRPNVFVALWEAHQARAVKDGHLELAGAATLLLTHARRVPEGQLVGVKLTRAGKGWAAFVDKTTGELLAIVPRPEIYLAGLQ